MKKSRCNRRSEYRLACSMKCYENMIRIDHNGGKGFTKPGKQKRW